MKDKLQIQPRVILACVAWASVFVLSWSLILGVVQGSLGTYALLIFFLLIAASASTWNERRE